MRISIDTKVRTFSIEDGDSHRTLDLFGKDAFELISGLWLKTSWNQKRPAW